MKNRKIVNYAMLYGDFIIYSLVSVFAKIASAQDTLTGTLLFMALEFCMLGVYAVIWQQALKRFPLIVAMSNKGITVILALAWSVLIFDEMITVWNIMGAVMIIFGIWMVSQDD